jgi:hypothetical protein
MLSLGNILLHLGNSYDCLIQIISSISKPVQKHFNSYYSQVDRILSHGFFYNQANITFIRIELDQRIQRMHITFYQ